MGFGMFRSLQIRRPRDTEEYIEGHDIGVTERDTINGTHSQERLFTKQKVISVLELDQGTPLGIGGICRPTKLAPETCLVIT